MSISDETGYKGNRHVFYNPQNAKAGVSFEFAHNKVLSPVNSLLDKVEKALSLKRDDSDYQNVAIALRTCSGKMGATLAKNRNEKVQTQDFTLDSDNPTIRNR